MRTLARFVIYVGGMTAGFLAIYQAVWSFVMEGRTDEKELLVRLLVGFTLVFAGTEISERMKKGG